MWIPSGFAAENEQINEMVKTETYHEFVDHDASARISTADKLMPFTVTPGAEFARSVIYRIGDYQRNRK